MVKKAEDELTKKPKARSSKMTELRDKVEWKPENSAEVENFTESSGTAATIASNSVLSPKTANLASEVWKEEKQQQQDSHEEEDEVVDATDSDCTIQVVEISSNGPEVTAEKQEQEKPKTSETDNVTAEQYVQSILQNAIHTGKEIAVIPFPIQPQIATDALPTPPSNPGDKNQPNVPSASSAFSGRPSVQRRTSR